MWTVLITLSVVAYAYIVSSGVSIIAAPLLIKVTLEYEAEKSSKFTVLWRGDEP